MKNCVRDMKVCWLMSVSMVIIMYISGCKPVQYPITTNPTLNIIQYFDNNPDFSLFNQALVKTGYAGFLGAYGGYTVFAPNNTAVTNYLKSINKSSVNDVDDVTLKSFVSFHIIQDTLATTSFTDGKLPTPTMQGQYLTTGAGLINGVASYTVNKQANILKPNIRTGNGIIHTIDHVLAYATLTISQIIAGNPKYSIFNQALIATGYADTLNVLPGANPKRSYLTLIAQTDSVFNAAGITSYADLKNKYSTTGNPKNPNDSLYLYVAYRIIPSIQFLGDIISSPSQTTLAPQENLTVALIGGNVVLNQVVFNGITEVGVPLDRVLGDVPAINGVVQSVKTNFKYKVRQPTPVYFDVCDQPELRKVTSVFRRVGQSLTVPLGMVAAYNWDIIASYAGETYTVDGTTGSKNTFVYNDYLATALRFGNGGVPTFFESTTPLIVKGVYKVWICYRTTGSSGQGKYTQVSLDGQTLSRIVDMTTALPSTTSSRAVLEQQGFKRYIADQAVTNNVVCAQLAGVVTINTTDVHKIRLTCIKNNGSGVNGTYLDMIEFIPVTMSQTDMCVTVAGTIIPTPSNFP